MRPELYTPLKDRIPNRRRRLLFIFVFCVGMTCIVIVLALAQSFLSDPTTPQPATGQIVPYNSHGDTHYVTQTAHDVIEWAQAVGIVAVFLCIGLAWKGRR
jgi:hypothetical protein